MPALALGQISDDFESAGISRWIVSVPGHWKAEGITPLSGLYSLHQSFDNTQSGNDQIGISLLDLKPGSGITTWSFKVRHGYNPSSSNSWGCFLMSDKDPSAMVPMGTVNGFVVGVNLSGYDDTLRLWKIKNGTVYKVFSSGLNWEKDIGISSFAAITVERSSAGAWKMSVKKGTTAQEWQTAGKDIELFNPLWFGFYYKYTSTADRLLWIDDVKIDGVFYTDTVPPVLIRSTVTGKNKVLLEFNESPDFQNLTIADFALNSESVKAYEIKKINTTSLEVSFPENFKNRAENEIVISNICDTLQNCSTIIKHTFTHVWAETGDVIITEVMADPIPSSGLPEKEYLEILNNSEFRFNLKGWTLVAGTTKVYFPDYLINPGEILILCSTADTTVFKSFGKVLGIKTFPALSDDGKLIVIYNEYGDFIHGVEYSSAWYGGILKEEGGWSLETEDTAFPFYYEGNWRASVSPSGGTPGRANSVAGTNPDKVCPVLLNVFPEDSVTISVRFSEPVFISEDIVSLIKIDGVSVHRFQCMDPLYREYTFKKGEALHKRESYELTLGETLADFASNTFCIKNAIFGLADKAERGDIQFNELLFNPYPDGADYIEFYNCSNKIIDAASLKIYSIDEAGDTSSVSTVSSEHHCIMPGSYYVISENRNSIPYYYNWDPDAVYEVQSLVPMDDDKGHIVLINDELKVIDEVYYNEENHFVLLSDREGVALEKIRQCIQSTESENWYSASESSGWGTPGLSNSVYSEEIITDDRVRFSSTKITPDNDGYEDLLVIDLRFENEGTVLTATVFDETGYPVKDLANNLLLGKDDTLIWDGTDNSGSLTDIGIYIIYLSGFDETGKVVKWKKVCSVLRR